MNGRDYRIASGEHRGSFLYLRDDGRADLVRPLTRDEVQELLQHVHPVGRAAIEDEHPRHRLRLI